MKSSTRSVIRGLKKLQANTYNGNTAATPYRRGSFTRKKLAEAHKGNRKIRGARKHTAHIASYYGY